MELGPVFSDAWRMTFRERTQWGFIVAMGVAFAALMVSFLVAMFAMFASVFSSDASWFEPGSPASMSASYEELAADFVGVFLGALVLYFLWGVMATYLRALMESGLAYSAGAMARGHRPGFGEIMREGLRFSPRVWAVQIASYHIPLFILYIGTSIVYTMSGAMGSTTYTQTGTDYPPMTPQMCMGMVFMMVSMLIGWMAFESWSQISVRHVVLWRQGVFSSLGQGGQVLRARFGSALAVVLAMVGTLVGLMVAFIISIAVLGNLGDSGPVTCVLFMMTFVPWVIVLMTMAYYSNVWTALVLRSRPEAGFAQPVGPPPGAYGPPPGAFPPPYAPPPSPSYPQPEPTVWPTPQPAPPAPGPPLAPLAPAAPPEAPFAPEPRVPEAPLAPEPPPEAPLAPEPPPDDAPA